MKIAKCLAWSVAAAALLQLAGCASFEFARPAPAQQQPVTLKLSGEELSGATDLPIGTYRVPDSHVIISGHQRGHAAGMMFGLIGVAVAHAANASSGADAVKDAEQQLKIKLSDPVQASIRDLIASERYGRYFTLNDQPGSNKLLITPGLILSFVSDASVRPYLVLKVSMTGSDGKPSWTTRYIASTADTRPLVASSDSWLGNDAAELRRALRSTLSVAMQTMAADVTRPYARDENRLTMVQGHYPHLKKRLQTVGFLLNEDDKHVAYVPRIGDLMTFAGVNIFEKKSVTFRPAAKEDSPFLIVDEQPVAAK